MYAQMKFLYAIESSNLFLFRDALEDGVDVNFRTDKDGNTPMMILLMSMSVILNGAKEEEDFNSMFDELCEHKQLDINICNDDGNSALHFACMFQNKRGIEKLVSIDKIELSLKNNDQETPIMYAKRMKVTHIVKILSNAIRQKNLLNAKLIKALIKGNLNLIKYYHTLGAGISTLCDTYNYVDWHQRKHIMETPLHIAAFYGFNDIVTYLLKNGVDVDSYNTGRNTPLIDAIYGCKHETVKLLIKHGANVNCRGHNGFAPIHIAVVKKSTRQIMITLLKSGCQINILDNRGRTPLNFCSFSTGKQIIQMMKNIDEENIFKETLLHAMVAIRNVAYVKQLLQHNANPNIKSSSGLTPIEMILSSNVINGQILLMLLQNENVDINENNICNDEKNFIDITLEKFYTNPLVECLTHIECLACCFSKINKKNLKFINKKHKLFNHILKFMRK
jgi:ankyrin repeat protein